MRLGIDAIMYIRYNGVLRFGDEVIMTPSKTAGALKGIFDEAKAQAAEAVMQPNQPPAAARNRKAGGRGVRISGYVPTDIDEALRDEVVKRTVAERRSVSFNDVLCTILADWNTRRNVAQ
jgi:hypothetical protein